MFVKLVTKPVASSHITCISSHSLISLYLYKREKRDVQEREERRTRERGERDVHRDRRQAGPRSPRERKEKGVFGSGPNAFFGVRAGSPVPASS